MSKDGEDNAYKFVGGMTEDVVVGLALSDFAGVIVTKGSVVARDFMSGVPQRITKHRIATLGHTSGAGIEVARLTDSWLQTCEGKQLGGIREARDNVPLSL